MTSEEKNKLFLRMTNEQFDGYMVDSYPKLFAQRYLPETETCMCWGFDIGPGWRYTLDRMCAKIQMICDTFPINIEFAQIKEKYGSGRFYFDSEWTGDENDSRRDAVYEIVSDIVSNAEDDTETICSITGEAYFTKLQVNGWVYDMSPEAFIAMDPETNKPIVESVKRQNNLMEDVKWFVSSATEEERNKILNFVKEIVNKK